MTAPNSLRIDCGEAPIKLNPLIEQMQRVLEMEAARLGLDVRTATWDIILVQWKIECQKIQAENDEREKARKAPLEVAERFLMETGELGTETGENSNEAKSFALRPTIASEATAAKSRNWSIITTTVPD